MLLGTQLDKNYAATMNNSHPYKVSSAVPIAQ